MSICILRPWAGGRILSTVSRIAKFRLQQVHKDHVTARTVADDRLPEAAKLPEADLAICLVAAHIRGQMPQQDAVQVQLVEPIAAQQVQRFAAYPLL